MRFYCTTGLILLVTASWAASTAGAQTESLYALALAVAVSGPHLHAFDAGQLLHRSGQLRRGPQPRESQRPGTGQPQTAPAAGDKLVRRSSAPCCDECATCNWCCGGTWFGAAGGLIMGRNRANPYWTTYQTNNNPNQLMNTQNAGTTGRAAARLRSAMPGAAAGGPALAFTYWGLAPMTGFSSVPNRPAISTPS